MNWMDYYDDQTLFWQVLLVTSFIEYNFSSTNYKLIQQI